MFTTTIITTTFLVLGDSYSSKDYAWARQLDQFIPSVHAHIYAIPGRMITYYTPSTDLAPWKEVDTVVVWLGAADAGRKPTEEIVAATQELVDTLSDRGFRVIYAMPPIITKQVWNTIELRAALATELTGAEIVDPPTVERQEDNVHPTKAGHFELAVWWMWTLYMMGV